MADTWMPSSRSANSLMNLSSYIRFLFAFPVLDARIPIEAKTAVFTHIGAK